MACSCWGTAGRQAPTLTCPPGPPRPSERPQICFLPLLVSLHTRADAGHRKKLGALTQLFAWASSTSAASALPRTPTPSQPSTPRRGGRTTEEAAAANVTNSDVMKMLEAFSGNGVQF